MMASTATIHNPTGANGWHGANRPANATERRVAAMLLENTGTALMDSGMYGRAWEQTRRRYGIAVSPVSTFSGGHLGDDPEPSSAILGRVARTMRAEPTATLDRWGSISANTFHFLTDRLTFDRALNAKWERFANRPHPDAVRERRQLEAEGRLDVDGWRVYDAWKSEGWSETIERWFDHLRASGAVLSGIYGDGEPLSENTYNGAEIIDRTLQYWHFTVSYPDARGHWSDDGPNAKWIEPSAPMLPEDTYTLLQIHGGADVRGGYTAPVLFSNREAEGIVCQPTAGVVCSVADGDGAMLADGTYPVAHRWDTSYDGETLCTEDGARLEMETAEDAERRIERATEDAEAERVRIAEGGEPRTVYAWEAERAARTMYGRIADTLGADGTVDGCVWECPFGDGGTLEPFAW